ELAFDGVLLGEGRPEAFQHIGHDVRSYRPGKRAARAGSVLDQENTTASPGRILRRRGRLACASPARSSAGARTCGAESRFGPGQLPIKRSLAHARSRVAV